MNMKKFETVLDVFKGTCELNNYKQAWINYSKELSCELEVITEFNKSYYYGVIFDKKSDYILGAVNARETDVYSFCEIINMAAKVLCNLDIEDFRIDVVGSDKIDIEEIISNLEALDLEVNNVNTEVRDGEDLSFSITLGDTVLALGGVKNDECYFKMRYSDLEKVYEVDLADLKSDVYISPIDKESLSDAFIIGSNLKDAGFKTAIDYSLKQVKAEDIDAAFLVTFGKEDIAKYEVKLVDLATKEIKTVGIDNLIEELAFI